MELKLETLAVRRDQRLMGLKISRPQQGNTINAALIRDLNAALDEAERSTECRTVILEGEPGVFCTGMDFREAASRADANAAETVQIDGYMNLLKRFSLSPKVIVCRLDGKVIAGGVGLAAASDLVISTSRTEFSLSEALWGLLPCCVIPFLIRRVGFQKAYAMTLTTRPISAAEAHAIHLVDELSENLDESIRKLTLRLNLLHEETIVDLKRYFQKMWLITPEVEKLAVGEITRLASLPRVRENIANYVANGTFPWEHRS